MTANPLTQGTSLPVIGAPRMVATNGVELAVWDRGSSALPPIVFCHGFPELAFSWRHQIAALPEAGLRVIAPDQRGYGQSSTPPQVEDYDMEHLTGDLVGLLDTLGIEKAVFCGHDWGGMVVWQMPLRHPDRVAGVIGVNTPFIPSLSADPIALFRAAYGDEMYIVRFQEPDFAESVLSADLENTFRFFMRRPDTTVEAFNAQPPERRNLALLTALAAFKGDNPDQQFLSAAEIAVFAQAFRRSGFFGPVSWYRNFTRNWERSEHLPSTIDVPCLMIMAEKDVVLPPSSADGMGKYIPALEKVLIEDCGHWTQQERPAETTAAILGWMRRTFG